MPFPLAHPAAVLPLRRYCPKFFSLPALMVGSISPDLGYCFGKVHAGEFSHQLLGSIGFCLPAGALMLALVYGVLLPLKDKLPDRWRRTFPWILPRPVGSPLVVALSLLVGAWTHLFWDSLTHTSGWLVEHLPLLHAPLGFASGHTLRVCHLLWYGGSFAGISLLFLSYAKWARISQGNALPADRKEDWRNAVVLAVLVLPIELIHHFVQSAFGLCFVVASTLALLFGFVWKIAPAKPDADRQRPPSRNAR